MNHYIDQFSDVQIRELRDSAEETFRVVYMTVADLPTAEWPIIKIKHLNDLKKTIAAYDSELGKRETLKKGSFIPAQDLRKSDSEVGRARRAARIFISYSHADESYRKTLEKHLALLARIGFIETWTDRIIRAGQDWNNEIQTRLQEADIVLLLVSANFLASDYAYDKEIAFALSRARELKTVVVPIILSPVDWKPAPFSSFQALPENAQPITTWSNEDEAWAQIASGIRRVVQGIGLECDLAKGMCKASPRARLRRPV